MNYHLLSICNILHIRECLQMFPHRILITAFDIGTISILLTGKEAQRAVSTYLSIFSSE